MKVLDLNKKEDKKILDTIKNLLKKENIVGELKISSDEELKGAIFVKVYASNIKSIDKAIKKGIKLNKEIDKIFPNKYIVLTVQAT